jgi:hypothetical protein
MKKHYRKENNCLNCGTTLEGKFCHNCGQENLQIKESFGHMLNHAISDYFHFDHQFFHTLKPLFFKPGLLTNEYMAGKRVQYLHPIKMYIFVSIVYFLIFFQSAHEKVKVTPTPNKPANIEQKKIDTINNRIAKSTKLSAIQKKKLLRMSKLYGVTNLKDVDGEEASNKDNHFITPTTDDTTYEQYTVHQGKLPVEERDGFFERIYNKTALTYTQKYGSRAREVFFDEFKHNVPKMMFLLLPMFALILKITFWRSKKFYVEHLIYTFHLHCFLFLFLAILMVLQLIIPNVWGLIGWLNFFSTIYIMWYIFRSLKVVYHRSGFRTITKMIGMSFIYLMAFGFCIFVVAIITALTTA